MALSQLRPMVIEGDRPAPSDQSGFTKLPDGSLIMRGQRPMEAKPGVLAGLREWFASKLNPAPPVDKYWIPPTPAPVAAAPMAAPVAAVAPGAALPPYDQWAEIEQQAAKEKAIADQLGPVSKKIMESPQIIEGKWWK